MNKWPIPDEGCVSRPRTDFAALNASIENGKIAEDFKLRNDVRMLVFERDETKAAVKDLYQCVQALAFVCGAIVAAIGVIALGIFL